MLQVDEVGLDPIGLLIDEETAAIEAYRWVIAAHRATDVAAELRDICANHRHAANLLRKHFRASPSANPTAERSRAAWHVVRQSAKGIPSIEVLKRGERIARELYRRAIAEDDLSLGARTTISAILIPQTERHVVLLDRLVKRVFLSVVNDAR